MRVPPSSLMERLRGRMGERGTAALLALAIEILIVLLLIFMAPVIPGKEKGAIPSVFSVDSGDSDEAQEATPEKAQQQRQAQSGKPRPTPPKPAQEPPPPQPDPPPPVELPDFLKMSRSQYATTDIRGRGTAPAAPAEPGTDSVAGEKSGGRMPGDSAVVGRAPNGEPLYAAAWYREPTHAELSPYISPRARGPGFGIVACRMVPSYRVEDCQVIGEGPGGYGYGGAVRQASFQFRVRPPRVGGKEMYGTWVRIRITYGQLKDDDGDE